MLTLFTSLVPRDLSHLYNCDLFRLRCSKPSFPRIFSVQSEPLYPALSRKLHHSPQQADGALQLLLSQLPTNPFAHLVPSSVYLVRPVGHQSQVPTLQELSRIPPGWQLQQEPRAMPLERSRWTAASTGEHRQNDHWRTSRSTSRKTACHRQLSGRLAC